MNIFTQEYAAILKDVMRISQDGPINAYFSADSVEASLFFARRFFRKRRPRTKKTSSRMPQSAPAESSNTSVI